MEGKQSALSGNGGSSLPSVHLWRSSPLDWRPIDRFMLLAAMLLLEPLVLGGFLLAVLMAKPYWLDPTWTYGILMMCAAYGIGLATFLVAAFYRRRHKDDWPLFENCIIISFIAFTTIGAYATGKQFSEALVLFFLGLNVSMVLLDIRKVYVGYLVVCVIMAVFAILILSGMMPSGPLFVRSLFKPDGAPVLGWLLLQITLAAILLAITYITCAAVKRWVDRENLYREMSTIDGLTRLTNRRSFIERGENEFSRAQRAPDTHSLACIILDIDHFKRINDTWGHHAGDAVLVALSAILLESKRQHDEVGRYGGEEFAILLPNATRQAALVVAERMRLALQAAVIEVDGKRIEVTASFGVSYYPSAGIEVLNDLLKAADKALYGAKAGGRNRVVAAHEGVSG